MKHRLTLAEKIHFRKWIEKILGPFPTNFITENFKPHAIDILRQIIESLSCEVFKIPP